MNYAINLLKQGLRMLQNLKGSEQDIKDLEDAIKQLEK